jgi:uncharacterized repeat protein (TIGR02543 family)
VTAAQDLTGAMVDDNGVLISASENDSSPVAIGFRALKPNNRYRYFWLYRVKFGIPATNLQTKGDSITFQTPSIQGTVMRRNRTDMLGKHPWKAEVTEGDAGVSTATIDAWYTEVYEPVYTPPTPNPPPPASVTVTYYPQGGTVTPANKSFVIGSALGALPVPVYDAHTFDGWFTLATDGTEVTADTVVDGTFDTIYARWTEITEEG